MLIHHNAIKTVNVSPEPELKIEFKKEPNENTLAKIWLNDNEV